MTITYGDILLVMISPAIGSFLAVMADRLPRGEDIVQRRSACRSCGHDLGPRDLVPIASFACARGRCRHCEAAIPAWLLYFEIIALGIATISVILAEGTAETWLTAIFLWTLMTLTVTDLLWFRLPDVLTALLFVVALALSWITGYPAPPSALWGAVIGASAFLALQLGYKALRGREGLGTGDIKLMAGLGAALGPWNLPMMLLIASLAAVMSALAGSLVSHRKIWAAYAVPFGAFLCAATAILWVLLQISN